MSKIKSKKRTIDTAPYPLSHFDNVETPDVTLNDVDLPTIPITDVAAFEELQIEADVEQNKILDELSRILLVNDFETSLKQLTPQITKDQIESFRNRDISQLEKAMPIIMSAALLKNKESSSGITLFIEVMASITQLMDEVFDEEITNEVKACIAKFKTLLGENDYAQKYLLKARALKEEELQQIISSTTSNNVVQKIIICFIPMFIKMGINIIGRDRALP